MTLAAPAQDNDRCLQCHDDPELTGTRGDQDISGYVDMAVYDDSVHAGQACVDCHRDVDPRRARHSTRRDLELVDCGVCHEAEARAQQASLHGAAAARGASGGRSREGTINT